MKLDKAIEILSDPHYQSYSTVNVDFPAALRLGIEALKQAKWHEEQHQPGYYELLPGETLIPDLAPSAERKQRLRESPLGREPRG